jgi:hypothetical protein
VDAAGNFESWSPVVSATEDWDFHWYRKSADRSWAHKRGEGDPQEDDASGTAPICNPCNADRNYGSLDYSNVVGSYCVT